MVRKVVVSIGFAWLLTAAMPAEASLIMLNDVDLSGQGIGAQLTVITLQSPANTTTESGGVNFDGSVFGDVQPGASQSRTFTLADVGLASSLNPGGELALVANLNEPGSETPPSVMTANPNEITLTVYNATGTTSTSFSAAPNLVLNQVNGGVGGSGIVFGLDAAQAAAFNAFVAANPGTEILALSATFANASGGVDVIQATNLTPSSAIPEPASLLLLSTGLFSAVRTLKKKRH